MSLVKNGKIAGCCHPNALMTLAEYLADYASDAVRRKGLDVIKRELSQMPDERMRGITAGYLEKIAAGRRDFRF